MALGMENYDIPSSSIQASSQYNEYLKPSYGRLNQTIQGRSWAAAVNNENQWLQVHFGNWTRVTGISTQGRPGSSQWVKTYRISYSYNGNIYINYKEGQNVKVFITCSIKVCLHYSVNEPFFSFSFLFMFTSKNDD